MADRNELVQFLDTLLNTAGIQDSSRNGLQVQGDRDVTRVGVTVDASMEAYRRAADAGCQMLVVHHGLIWGGGITSVTGPSHDHLQFLLANGLNLYASHLPLDMHAEHGNNAGLARMLGLQALKPFGLYHGLNIGFAGELPEPRLLEELAASLRADLGGPVSTLPFGPRQIRRVGIVSGGAGDMVPEAVLAHLDCYVTGEPVHHAHHLALEGGVNVLFAGHYHTETPGVRSLGQLLTTRFGIEHIFLDIPTLV